MILRDPAPPRLRWPAALGLFALAAAALPFAPTLADDPPRPVETAPPVDPPARPDDPPPRTTVELPPIRTTVELQPLPTPSRTDPRPTTPAPAASNHFSPGEDVERLRDEVELLAAQLPTRRAAVRIAKNALVRAEEQVSSAQGMVKKGFASAAEVRKAELDVEDARAQLEMREAELREHELRIAQAKRRLDRHAAVRPPGPARESVPSLTAPRSAPPRPGADSTRPTPAPKERLDRLDDEAAKLAAERDVLAAQLLALEKRLAELKVMENDLQNRIEQLRARRTQEVPRKDDGPSRRR